MSFEFLIHSSVISLIVNDIEDALDTENDEGNNPLHHCITFDYLKIHKVECNNFNKKVMFNIRHSVLKEEDFSYKLVNSKNKTLKISFKNKYNMYKIKCIAKYNTTILNFKNDEYNKQNLVSLCEFFEKSLN